jgi:hypothetical protein
MNMFEQVFENLRTATETGMRLQHDMIKQWTGLWPGGAPAANPEGAPTAGAQKKWADFVTEQVKRQRETMETQFSAGLKNIEEAFHLAEAKDPEELRARTVELWQKSFDCLRKLYESQLRDFQAAAVKWTELVTRNAA